MRHDHSMVPLVGLESDLLLGLEFLLLQFVHFACKHCLRGGRRVDAVRLKIFDTFKDVDWVELT